MRFAMGGTLTDGEGRAHVGDLERVEDNRGQITLGLGGAGKVCELALPEQHTEAGSTQKVSQKPRHTRLKLYTSKRANGILQGLIPAELRTGRCHAGPRQTGTRCRAASGGKDLHFAKRRGGSNQNIVRRKRLNILNTRIHPQARHSNTRARLCVPLSVLLMETTTLRLRGASEETTL